MPWFTTPSSHPLPPAFSNSSLQEEGFRSFVQADLHQYDRKTEVTVVIVCVARLTITAAHTRNSSSTNNIKINVKIRVIASMVPVFPS